MQRDGLEAVGCAPIFEDHGISGAKSSRPGLDALLAEIRTGDTVVVFKLDRLGRSVLHLADLLVRFQMEGEGINTTTPGGKLTFHLFSVVVEFQRDIIVENTAFGIEAARKRGKQIRRPYSLTPDTIVDVYCAMMQLAIRVKEHPDFIRQPISSLPMNAPRTSPNIPHANACRARLTGIASLPSFWSE
jgi:hypothetical protein